MTSAGDATFANDTDNERLELTRFRGRR
jgi:hypothetical protein